MRHLFLLLFLPFTHLFAQPLSSVNPYYVGHSLINLNVPAMVNSLANDAGKTSDYAYQIGNGANLWWQWDTLLGNEQGIPWQEALPTGDFDAMIVTEAVPLLGHLQWSKTYDYADSFLMAARAYRPDIRFFVYETWHCTTTGTPTGCEWDNNDNLLWRPRLAADFPLWTGIMDSLKGRHPAAAVWMIPAGQAFGMLTDSIVAGGVPGISDFKQLFSDDIHLTDAGNYFVACVMYACLFRESPEGRTNQTFSEWGSPYNPPSPALALKMQQVAWKTVTQLGVRTGVNSSSKTVEPDLVAEIQVFPNPGKAGGEVRVASGKEILSIEVLDSRGNILFRRISLNGMFEPFTLSSSGLHFVKISLKNGRSEVRKLILN